MLKRLSIRNNTAAINSLVHNLKYTDKNGNVITIASDAAINERILTKYKFYDYLYTIEDANKVILQDVINSWRLKAIELYKTTLWEYEPLWNVDGTETTTTTTVYGHKIEYAAGKTDTTTDTLKVINQQTVDAEGSTNYGRTDTMQHQTDASMHRYDNGYDSSTAAPSFNETSNDGTKKNTAGGSDTTSFNAGKTEEQHSGGTATTHTGKDTDTHSGTDKTTVEVERHGNIGVTSSQSLVQASRDLIIDVVEFYVEQFAGCFNINPLVFLDEYATREDI